MPKHDSKIAADATTALHHAVSLGRSRTEITVAMFAAAWLMRVCAQRSADRLRAELAALKQAADLKRPSDGVNYGINRGQS